MFFNSIWEPSGTRKSHKNIGGSFQNEVSAGQADELPEPQIYRHFKTVSHIMIVSKFEISLIAHGKDFEYENAKKRGRTSSKENVFWGRGPYRRGQEAQLTF